MVHKMNSGNICDEYAAKYDYIRVIHQQNKGLAEVRNVCIEQATGEYHIILLIVMILHRQHVFLFNEFNL